MTPFEKKPGQRRLAALMFTDMVGSSRLFQADEFAAKTTLEEMHKLVRESVSRHNGREMDNAGDGFFLQFVSTVDAYECAFEIQARIYEYNLQQTEDLRFKIRIGIHIGEFFEENGRAVGDDVNIAARIEQNAEAGGIAVSQQAYDHLDGKVECQFESIGFVPLKNISRKIHLYKAMLPWAKAKVSKFAFLRGKSLRQSRWFGLIAMAAVAVGASLSLASIMYDNIQVRSAAVKIPLNAGWKIQVNKDADWLPFEHERNWIYADDAIGSYRLRKTVTLSTEIAEPAIVLGYIPDQYRIKINGFVVGGADRMSPVEYFAFDKSILKINEPNLIEVEAETKGSTYPGINTVPSIGSFLSDLPHAYSVIHRDRLLFHNREIAMGAISALLFLSCLLSWSFSPRNRTRAYHTAYLFGCALFVLDSMYWFFSSEPYWLQSLFRVLPLCICPLILISSHFAESGKLKLEFLNNILFYAMTAAILLTVAIFPPSPSHLISLCNIFYAIAVTYGLVTCVPMAWSIYKKRAMPSAMIAIGFNLTSSLVILRTVSDRTGFPFNGLIYKESDVLLTFPLVFATAIALFAAWDHAVKSREVRHRQRALEINRKLLSILVKGTTFEDRISRIQRITCRQLGIDKSTIYLVDQKADKMVLKAASVIRNFEHEANLAAEIIDPSPDGILGYVCQVRSPLLIEDLANDNRFAKYISARKTDQFYTRSCMIFPLVAGDRLLAVITFSDKAAQGRFTVSDFKFASHAAHVAQVLCQLEMPPSAASTARLVG